MLRFSAVERKWWKRGWYHINRGAWEYRVRAKNYIKRGGEHRNEKGRRRRGCGGYHLSPEAVQSAVNITAFNFPLLPISVSLSLSQTLFLSHPISLCLYLPLTLFIYRVIALFSSPSSTLYFCLTYSFSISLSLFLYVSLSFSISLSIMLSLSLCLLILTYFLFPSNLPFLFLFSLSLFIIYALFQSIYSLSRLSISLPIVFLSLTRSFSATLYILPFFMVFIIKTLFSLSMYIASQYLSNISSWIRKGPLYLNGWSKRT